MGTEISYNDEWIELYNNTDYIINLIDWSLKASDGTPEINLDGEISPKSFYLLERTDDNTIPTVSSDKIYTGSLGNQGEVLNLYDNSRKLIDSVNCEPGWFAGDNETKKTMERKNSQITGNDLNNWQSSQNPGGTPRTTNSRQLTIIDSAKEDSEKPAVEEGIIQTKNIEEKTKIIYPQGVVFNELLPSPEGSDEENEWVELLNQNDFEINLTSWQITDTAGSIRIYTFPKETKISAKGFLVISRPETKIILNNDFDGLKLLQPDGVLADEVNYKNAPQPPPAQSYNRTDSEWVWSKNLSPSNANIIAPKSNQNDGLNTREEELENSTPKTSQLAAIKEQIPKNNFSFFIFMIAAGIALFSGVGALLLKKVLQQKKNLLKYP